MLLAVMVLLLSAPRGTVVQAQAQPVDEVERRGLDAPLEGEIIRVSDAGVSLRKSTGAVYDVPWDRVRTVRTERVFPRLDEHLARAEDVWRARSRLERRDTTLAEPLFARLFEHYRGQTHETALVVAEGLLRCKLARMANDAAMIPALETLRLRSAGVTTISYTMLEPVIDEERLLCPQLPPLWDPAHATVRLERSLAQYDAQGDAVIAAIASLYRESVPPQARGGHPIEVAEDASGEESAGGGGETEPGETAGNRVQNHPGVDLLSEMIAAQRSDAAARRSARAQLRRRLEGAPDWQQAWIHAGLGRSLLREEAMGPQMEGALELTHLPAVHAYRGQSYLVGLALRWLAERAEARGEDEAAQRFRAELAQRIPNHPARQADRSPRVTSPENRS